MHMDNRKQNITWTTATSPRPPHRTMPLRLKTKKRTIAIKKLLQQNLMHSAEMDLEERIFSNKFPHTWKSIEYQVSRKK
jgi:hypothetical protein